VTTAEPESAAGNRANLTPYVPRVVVEWLRTAPDATQRELDGTLAFVDLSGFTAMSERLAGRGKAGAEELTDVINKTFSSLLDVAYENGGGLLKMGGDALLLFFSGEEHCPRAARAAFGMRQTLRELGRPRTSAGAVTLRMHVGIHTGTFQFFLVGDSHRELLLAGPAVTETVAMEAGAEAGEILLSQAAAAALPTSASGAEKAGGRLLKRNVPVSTTGLEPLPDVAGLPLELCVPVAIRDYLGGDPVEPEHRQATVAFVQFAGSDRLLAEHGAPALAEALEELVRAVQTAAEEHHVSFLETDIDVDGGRLVLVAGAPSSAGDDDERMLRTVRAIVDAKVRLPLQIGVNRGRVFAGEVGAPVRRAYTILGDTAALAARLMARAEQGAILAAQEVVERSRTQFETTELEPFRVKGKKATVVAHEVGAVTGERSAAQPATTAFVGRERELTVLGASLAPVRMGFGSLVELIGDPGMGKSRLIEELQRQNPDLEYVSTSCQEYEQSTPYFPFRGLLEAVLDQPLNGSPPKSTALLRERLAPLAPELVPWIPLLSLPLDLELESTPEVDELQPAFRRARLHGVVETLLTTLLPTPTLLAIEDVHWMDEASSDLLRHLGSQVTSKPSLICATRRPGPGGFIAAEGVPPVAALTIHLEPLGVEAAKSLIDAAGANGMHPDEVAAITERAGGNPLFLQELVTSERREAEVELPESVEAVIVARIDKLAPADRTLLRFASVMGSSFSGELVGRVLAQEDPSASADSETWDRLNEFVERDPYTPGAFRFRHALFRDSAYEGLSYRRRRELHAAVGDAYEALYPDDLAEHAEMLSLHFLHAQRHEKAYQYSLLAGKRAQAKFANIEAAAFYRRALEAARRLPALAPGAVAKVWEALGDVCELAGRYVEAAEAYTKARRLAAKDGDDQPSLLHKEGLIRERSSRYPQALRWYRRALAAAERLEADGDQSQIAREIRLAYAGVRLRQGEFHDCIKWSRSVVEQALAVDDLPALAHAYHLLHLAYTSLGSPERVAFRGLALPIYEEIGDLLGQANVLNNLGIDAYYEGRWDAALDIYRRSRELRDRVGDVVGAATATNNIGEIKSDQGHYEEAAGLFEEVYSITSSAGALFLANLARSNLGRLAARRGHTDEAETLLRDALAGFEEIEARSFVLETNARLAEHAVLTDRGTDALVQAEETMAALDEAGGGAGLVPMVHRLRGYALMQTGDLDGASAAIDEGVRAARETGETYELALSLEAHIRLASLRKTTAPDAEKESAAIFERLGVVARPEIP
jgi:class 3 adenylate cyclase/tetratricopeptide (TPR) repeat protein